MDPVARTSQGGQESRRGLESIPGRGGTQDKQPPAPPTHTLPKASSQPPRLCLSVGFKSTGDMYNPIISPCPTACFWGPAGHTRALQEASRGDRTSEGRERARQEGDMGAERLQRWARDPAVSSPAGCLKAVNDSLGLCHLSEDWRVSWVPSTSRAMERIRGEARRPLRTINSV